MRPTVATENERWSSAPQSCQRHVLVQAHQRRRSARSVGRCAIALLAVLLAACAVGADAHVPPPTTVPPSFKTEIPPPLESGRLPTHIKPLRYAVALEIDPASERFSGEVLIEVRVERPSSVIVLHGADLEITEAEILVGKRAVRAKPSFRKAAGAVRAAEELVLVAADPIPTGRARIHIVYSAPLKSDLRGLYRVKHRHKHYAFTQFEPADARRMLPCFDDPAYKVPFDLRVTVPKGNQVFGNTPEQSREPASDGKRTTVSFATTPPMPTYLLALAIGPLEVFEGPKEPVPIRVIAVKGKTAMGAFAIEASAALLDILGEYLGRPYPYAKLDLVAVPNFAPGAMENAGLMTFREELLLLEPDKASAKARRRVATILAHELAHQWFGNLVTMKWWDDLWLNEGFATYIEALVVDRWKPSMGASLALQSWTGRVMELDALDSVRAVRQPVRNTYEAHEAFDGITYGKGARVLGMLHSWLGEEAFQTGVQAYLKAHEWGNATADDLFQALSAPSDQDVSAVAAAFLDRRGVPLVSAELSCKPGMRPTVELSQSRYRARPTADEPESEPPWSIPVCIAYGQPWQRAASKICTLLTGDSTSVELPVVTCPGWINPNAGYQGYYRHSLPSGQLAAQWRAAKARDAQAMIGFLSNAWALVQSGHLPADDLLGMLAATKNEQRLWVVDEVISILHRVSDSLVQERTRARFQSFVSSILLPTAQRLGWDHREFDSDQDRLLRHSVLSALAILAEHPWLADEASRRARAFLQQPDSSDPDTAAIALRVAARRGDPKVGFGALVAALNVVRTPEQRVAVMRALGSLGETKARGRAFDLITSSAIRAQDARYIAAAAVDWPDSRAHFIRWLQQKLSQILERYPGFGAARMISAVRRLCDQAARDAAGRAFEPVLERHGRGKRRLREVLESADVCIDLRNRQSEAAAAYFERGQW